MQAAEERSSSVALRTITSTKKIPPALLGSWPPATDTSGATGWAGSGRKMYSFDGTMKSATTTASSDEPGRQRPSWRDDSQERAAEAQRHG